MILSELHNKFSNYTKAIKTLLRGEPFFVKRWNKFIKISLLPASVKQLNREVANNQLACEWETYSSSVVSLNKITPFAAVGKLIKRNGASWDERYLKKQNKMIDISIGTLTLAVEAPQKPANEIIYSLIDDLGVVFKKDRDLFLSFKKIIESQYFDYQIPVLPMHGDFHPNNAIISGNKLFLVDWEYASKEGSIIYDWWDLRKYINNSKIDNKKTRDYFIFLDDALEKLGINYHQFDAFGLAMYSIIHIYRLQIRNSRYRKRRINTLHRYLNRLQKIHYDWSSADTVL